KRGEPSCLLTCDLTQAPCVWRKIDQGKRQWFLLNQPGAVPRQRTSEDKLGAHEKEGKEVDVTPWGSLVEIDTLKRAMLACTEARVLTGDIWPRLQLLQLRVALYFSQQEETREEEEDQKKKQEEEEEEELSLELVKTTQVIYRKKGSKVELSIVAGLPSLM